MDSKMDLRNLEPREGAVFNAIAEQREKAEDVIIILYTM